MSDGLWFWEEFTDSLLYGYRVEEYIFSGRSKFQQIDILRLGVFGKTLFLDKKVQSAQIDEFVFHESLVHPAIITHGSPEKVLIIGGGEGATLREVLRAKGVKRAVMVDIDGELVELCKEHMPEWSAGAFEDPRAEVIIDDAYKYLHSTDEKFDVIISDLTEPLEGGPSIKLFTREYFQTVYEHLNEGGVLAVQSGSADPYYNQFFSSLTVTLREVFPVVRPYWAFVFSFNMPWGFNLASKITDPIELDEDEVIRRMNNFGFSGLKYLNASLFHSSFSLPQYLRNSIDEAEIISEDRPFIWKE